MTTPILDAGPNWQVIAIWLIGVISLLFSIVMTLIGSYAKGVSTRVTKLENDFGNLHALVKGDYPTRQEIQQSFNQVQDGLRAITSRLDNLIDHNRG